MNPILVIFRAEPHKQPFNIRAVIVVRLSGRFSIDYLNASKDFTLHLFPKLCRRAVDKVERSLIRSQGVAARTPLIEDVAFENVGKEKSRTDAYRLFSQFECFISLVQSVEADSFPVQCPWMPLDPYCPVIVGNRL